jgi:putative transposase
MQLDIHGDDPEFGYRFIADELERGGHEVGEGRVHRLCREHKIWSTTTKKGRRTTKTPGPAVHDDLVNRDFSAPAPNVTWLTDITEHPTSEGKLYCCAIKDCFSNRIVGYAMADRMTAALAVHALRSAVARRQPSGTVVVHSDRGGQFRSRAFSAVLKANHLSGSMGRVSSAGDNAAMESFYSLLQKNVLNRRRWRTRNELAYEITYWIEHTYNRRRRQRGLGRLSPVEYELAFSDPVTDVA